MNETKKIDQHALDLLNCGLDGELGPTEQKELRALLASSAKAREINDELTSFAELMANVPELEPPANFQESVERQVRLPVQGATARGNHGALRAWLYAGWLRTGAALAVGVVLTVSVYEMGSGPISDKDASNIVGTVVKNPVSGPGKLLDQVHISKETMNGLVELYRFDDLFTLDVQLSSDESGEFILNFADQELEFEGVAGRQGQSDVVTVADGAVNIVVTGERHYTLNFRRKAESFVQTAAPLELAFYTGNHLVQKVELSISEH